ncbi:MAG TPA: hypothetical protein VI279_12085 [Rhodocyclaceae bacterium]
MAFLHLALFQGVVSPLGRTLLLAHVGLFLLWQPFVRAESQLASPAAGAIILLIGAGLIWVSWWVMVLWVMLLAGTVGGQVFLYSARSPRLFHLIALAYLIAVLLVFVVPQAVPRLSAGGPVLQLAEYGLPVLFLAMALLPGSHGKEAGPGLIDLAYSALLILLLAVLVLGSVSLMALHGTDYISALLTTILTMAAMLFLLSWVWNPRAGFAGLGSIASRYMLSLGLPFEQWLHSLAALAGREEDPFHFLQQACCDMLGHMPGIVGGEWHAEGQHGRFGVEGEVSRTFAKAGIVLTLHARHDISPVLVWHFGLVTQLLGEFFRTKQRDRRLRDMAYVQAVHETGARLTHDVKNLLQSLNALVFAAQARGKEEPQALQEMFSRQLPLVAQRLQQTLDKLTHPVKDSSDPVPMADWWGALQQRYTERDIGFKGAAIDGFTVPGALFTNAAENLLQNALEKRALEPGIEISIEVGQQDGIPGLKVCDSGSPVPANIAANLGFRPVTSESGLGIGLYQASNAARLAGYQLKLISNQAGKVCFCLCGA